MQQKDTWKLKSISSELIHFVSIIGFDKNVKIILIKVGFLFVCFDGGFFVRMRCNCSSFV